MNTWIAEFDLEYGDTMPEHMDLEYKGAKLDFHCRPLWIPVSERLPEDNGFGYYLTTTMFGEVYCDYWTGTNFDRQETVIAWMPLPEPYKGRKEEEE